MSTEWGSSGLSQINVRELTVILRKKVVLTIPVKKQTVKHEGKETI